MCLENAKLVSGKTTKPIKCYKVLIEDGDWLFTPYVSSRIEIGGVYESNVKHHPLSNKVDVAIHSFANFKDAVDECDYQMSNAHDYNNVVIALCEIPAGSIVYKGTFADGLISYASSSIKYKRILRRFKA